MSPTDLTGDERVRDGGRKFSDQRQKRGGQERTCRLGQPNTQAPKAPDPVAEAVLRVMVVEVQKC